MKNLYDAFNLYCLGHITDYGCTSCKMRATGEQRITIQIAPRTLCIQLNLFEQLPQTAEEKAKNEIKFSKLTYQIQYPEYLDMGKYTVNKEQPLRYRLGSVISHLGDSIDSGHYKAFCYVQFPNMTPAYYEFDDMMVARTNAAIVLHQQAYMLFYHLDMDETE